MVHMPACTRRPMSAHATTACNNTVSLSPHYKQRKLYRLQAQALVVRLCYRIHNIQNLIKHPIVQHNQSDASGARLVDNNGRVKALVFRCQIKVSRHATKWKYMMTFTLATLCTGCGVILKKQAHSGIDRSIMEKRCKGDDFFDMPMAAGLMRLKSLTIKPATQPPSYATNRASKSKPLSTTSSNANTPTTQTANALLLV